MIAGRGVVVSITVLALCCAALAGCGGVSREGPASSGTTDGQGTAATQQGERASEGADRFSVETSIGVYNGNDTECYLTVQNVGATTLEDVSGGYRVRLADGSEKVYDNALLAAELTPGETDTTMFRVADQVVEIDFTPSDVTFLREAE